MKTLYLRILLLTLVGHIGLLKLSAQNIDGRLMWPLAQTTLPKNILYNGQPLLFTGQSFNPYLGINHAYIVMVPPEWYDNPTQRFPVHYVWHGTSAGSSGQGIVGTANPADTTHQAHAVYRWMRDGHVRPHITVWPSLGPNNAVGGVEEWLIKDFMPYVEQTYRAESRGELRTHSGNSMGGLITLRLTLTYPQQWSSWLNTISAASFTENYSLDRGDREHFNQWVYGAKPNIERYKIDRVPGLSVWEGTGRNVGSRSHNYLMSVLLAGTRWDTMTAVGCGHDTRCSYNVLGPTLARFIEDNWVRVIQTKTNKNNLVREAGTSDTVWLHLLDQPTSPVTVNPVAGAHVTTTSGLVFDGSNYNIPQPVVITAIDNSDADGERQTLITYNVSSADSKYQGARSFATRVTVSDNEVQPSFHFDKLSLENSPHYAYYSGAYAISEHAARTHRFGGCCDTIPQPKNRHLGLKVRLQNPDPTQAYSARVRLVDGHLTFSNPFTARYASADDFQPPFSDTLLNFAPGVQEQEFFINPVEDNTYEGSEVAQFALSCPQGGASVAGSDVANIAIQDLDLNRNLTSTSPIISEVYHGTQPGEVAVEIFNTRTGDISLSGYQLRILAPGSTDWTTADVIPDLVAPAGNSFRGNDAIVLGGSRFSDSAVGRVVMVRYPQLDQVTPYHVIGLFRNNTLVDVVGTPGGPTNGGITVSGQDSATHKVMIRKPMAYLPRTDFSPEVNSTFAASEWMVEPAGSSKTLGYHLIQSGQFVAGPTPPNPDLCATVGLPTASVVKNNMGLYPNPTSQSFRLTGLAEQPAIVQIADLSGRRMEFVQLVSGAYQVPTDLPCGIYVVKAGLYTTKLDVQK